MEIIKISTENLLTKRQENGQLLTTLILILLIQLFTSIYHFDFFHLSSKVSASHESIYIKHEYYRLWTTLFVHADLEHLGSNMLLLAPFAYFVSAQFGIILFPFMGIFLGGLINYIVLSIMTNNIELIGISGIVYWLGAVYLTLYLLIENREKINRRIMKSIGIALILFFPTILKENVSYLSHALGFLFGFLSAISYYLINLKKIKSNEKYEYKIEYDDDDLALIKSFY